MTLFSVIKAPPETEPVTLAEMRAHLGIGQADDTDRDTIITRRIVTARMIAESYIRSGIVTQTWTAYGDAFDRIIALKAPLQSVTSIQYLDADGVLQTVDPSVYEVDTVSHCVLPAPGQQWPTPGRSVNSVQIEYVIGYATIPEPIKDAIKFIVGWLENYQRGIEGSSPLMGVPMAAKQLLDYYVDWRSVV